MTVERLIKELSKFPPKAVVRLNDRLGLPCLFVLAIQNDDNNVWLENEADCDLREELSARFKTAVEENLDETDFYSDLLEIGIDVDTVRRYMGDDCDNPLEAYCEEHGLI